MSIVSTIWSWTTYEYLLSRNSSPTPYHRIDLVSFVLFSYLHSYVAKLEKKILQNDNNTLAIKTNQIVEEQKIVSIFGYW